MSRRTSIADFYKKRGGDLFVLVFSLLLAFFMWSMYRLSLEYSSVFEYKVKLTTNLVGRSKSSVSRNSVIIRGRTSGFSIIQHRIKGSGIEISLDSQYLRPAEEGGDVFGVSSSDIRNELQNSLGSDFRVESVVSDTLFFNFPKQSYKKVPVKLVSKVACRPQFAIFSRILATPDSVYIYGNTDKIASIDYVQTKAVKKNMADSPIQGVVRLEEIDGVRISENEVYYAIDVQRYYENSCKVSVTVTNNPLGSLVTVFPQEVTVTYWAPYQKKSFSPSDFNVVADYSQLFASASGESGKNIRLELLSVPDGLFNIRITPQTVGCLVN